MSVSYPASAKIYTRQSLSFYDFWVLMLSNHFFWKCPSSFQLKFFEAYQSKNHLDVGVGTGYYLRKSAKTSSKNRLALMDINRNSLTVSELSLIQFAPEIYIQDILHPIHQKIKPFDSISLYYVLHCLKGPMSLKAPAIGNLKKILNPGGVLFGTSILGLGATFNPIAAKLMAIYNRKGIFGNLNDSYPALETILKQHFENVECQVYGHVALFAASDVPIKHF